MRISSTLKIACTATLSLTSAFLMPRPTLYIHGTLARKIPALAPSKYQLQASSDKEQNPENESSPNSSTNTRSFDLETALFAAGLAFDSYLEPEENSSRWERGVRCAFLDVLILLHIQYSCSSKLTFLLHFIAPFPLPPQQSHSRKE